MSLTEQLETLDAGLLARFGAPEQLDGEQLQELLAERARLLALLLEQEMLSPGQVNALMARSEQLKQQAEHTRQRLAEQLAGMQKGRRSVGAYQKIKHQE
ncbi:hypothetical protein PU634_03085 [Oceanimonas pelagia]|uniref:Uncharacterized protein n=1 Tax=Oceanimonas pelagia TaxID=3028314 RepID=A0AA50QCL1_9GAMM|nr:hypothetical protein [Oceanimonas pelagia]WMC11362.1 hypothetical protein PU634_03085 [Oceanimonas pelagia]